MTPCRSLKEELPPVIPERLYGITGFPLGHSLSPLLHNWGFSRLGVKAAYLAFPTPADKLAELIRAVRALPISGLSVTIPHKQAVIPLLDGLAPEALEAGAVNTLAWEQGRLLGRNTDLAGFMRPLAELPDLPRSALVLGAGGAARAALAGLARLGLKEILVAGRDLAKAEALARDLRVRAAAWEDRAKAGAQLVVNATPLGMTGPNEGRSPLPAAFWKRSMLAYDLVYNPLKTRFLGEAEAAGARIIDGLSMFAAQGAAQFKLWTGLDLPMPEVRELLGRALA
jgi:shikimate dehydrogenase